MMIVFLPVLYELDAKEEWNDPKKWQKANPALGTIKKVDDLIRKVERAKNNPNDLNGLLVKDFNIRDAIHSAWLSFDDINNEETFNIEDFRGGLCYRWSRPINYRRLNGSHYIINGS